MVALCYFCRLMQRIGKITGIHGLGGEIVLHHQLKRNTRFDQWDCLMVELNPGSYIPFFIQDIRSTMPDECICKLEEINNREEAKLVLNKPVYSSINYSVDTVVNHTLQQYKGFVVYDGDLEVGPVLDTIVSTLNPMFVVLYQGREVLLPSSHELIRQVQQAERKIIMDLPEGLLDL